MERWIRSFALAHGATSTLASSNTSLVAARLEADARRFALVLSMTALENESLVSRMFITCFLANLTNRLLRWDNGAAPATERRIDNWTIRVYDLFKYGDSLAFSWYHPDNNNPNYEWLDINFNGAKWNDRDSNCGRPGPNHNCCEIGPWYSDGPNRMVCTAVQD
jgi:hypothetical protein